MNVEDQTEVIDFLSRPGSHRGEAVERIDTHISAVFLVGDRVYKLKRSVRFGYLDYSTLARRERFCRAELEINGAMAPDIYRAVVPVTRAADGRLSVDGPGTPVEWLVVMNRFDQEGLFDRLASRGKLDETLMRSVADLIFDFHAGAPKRPRRKGAGVIGRVIDSNDTEIGKWTGPIFDKPQAAAVSEKCHAALEALKDLLNQRSQAGALRRCHGDLHLRNICLFEGQPTLFDAIEFSEDFSAIDVFYDLAFLLMDLEHRGLGSLANVVLNRYLGRGCDFEGLLPLPLFLSCRAAIRAHVTAETTSRTKTQKDRTRLAKEARGYLATAEKFFEDPGPRLIALGGPSGTGKSTLARAIAPGLGRLPGAVVIRSDLIRKSQMGVPPESKLESNAYSKSQTKRVFQALNEGAAMALRAGFTVVADAVFGGVGQREAIEDVARTAGVPFSGLWLQAPREVLERRVAARHDDASDADVTVLRKQLGVLPESVDWQGLDVSGTSDQAIESARQSLGLTPAPRAGA